MYQVPSSVQCRDLHDDGHPHFPADVDEDDEAAKGPPGSQALIIRQEDKRHKVGDSPHSMGTHQVLVLTLWAHIRC